MAPMAGSSPVALASAVASGGVTRSAGGQPAVGWWGGTWAGWWMDGWGMVGWVSGPARYASPMFVQVV